jgi:hypothetical protein
MKVLFSAGAASQFDLPFQWNAVAGAAMRRRLA